MSNCWESANEQDQWQNPRSNPTSSSGRDLQNKDMNRVCGMSIRTCPYVIQLKKYGACLSVSSSLMPREFSWCHSGLSLIPRTHVSVRNGPAGVVQTVEELLSFWLLSAIHRFMRDLFTLPELWALPLEDLASCFNRARDLPVPCSYADVAWLPRWRRTYMYITVIALVCTLSHFGACHYC
jgi:hypothetical protein